VANEAGSHPYIIDRQGISWGKLHLLPIAPADISTLPSDFCGDPDLNEFFKKDSLKHDADLMTKTYKLVMRSEPETVLGLVSLLNDALPLEDEQKNRNAPEGKRYRPFPAVKIGRLGIRNDLRGAGLGSAVIGMIKSFFLTMNRTGCRFITVDAYNKPDVLHFYESNKFVAVEKRRKNPHTVSMFYNLSYLQQTR